MVSESQHISGSMERFAIRRSGPPPVPEGGLDPCDRLIRAAVQESVAAQLELDWPLVEPVRVGGGRPTFDEVYEAALRTFVRSVWVDPPEQLPPAKRPRAWRPGMPLWSPPEGALDRPCAKQQIKPMRVILPPDAVDSDSAEPSGGEAQGPPRKKPYHRPVRELRDWTTQYALLRKR